MSNTPLPAHSLAEAKLYLLASSCDQCSRGPVRSVAERVGEQGGTGAALTVTARCDSCGHQHDVRFTIPAEAACDPSEVINATGHPSRVLDLSQWLTLATMLTEAARQESDKPRMRQLRIEAGMCLDEALKFFDDEGNDLPPIDAFYSDLARTRFRENPERFSRQRLRAIRLALPRSMST